MYVCLVSVNVLLCRLIMGPFGPYWVFSTQEGISYYRNVHVSEGEIAVLAAVACYMLYVYLYNQVRGEHGARQAGAGAAAAEAGAAHGGQEPLRPGRQQGPEPQPGGRPGEPRPGAHAQPGCSVVRMRALESGEVWL